MIVVRDQDRWHASCPQCGWGGPPRKIKAEAQADADKQAGACGRPQYGSKR